MGAPYGSAAPQLGATFENADLPAANRASSAIPQGRLVLLDAANGLGAVTPGSATGQLNREAAPLDQAPSVPSSTFENLGIAVALPTNGVPAVGSLGWSTTTLHAYGGEGAIRLRGIVPCFAAGSVDVGDLISACSTSPRLGFAQAASSGEECIGQALTPASTDQVVLVRLFGSITIAP